MIKEWNLLRTLACLSIVLLHSTTQIGRAIGYNFLENYHLIRIILASATPTFIVLSEIILANKYKYSIPQKFFSKRFKLIILPFISFAIIDALVVNYLASNGIDIYQKILNNLLGHYVGYFILIIFQFYILHYIILKYNISVKKILPVSILIMVAHLLLINTNLDIVNDYKSYLKLPFTAWFGYFTVAFLIGNNYEIVAKFLKTYRWIFTIIAIFTIYFIYLSFQSGNTQIDSRRIDIFPLTIAISLMVIAWGQIIPNFKIVNIISNYSLGIYLVHWQVQRFITPYVVNYTNSPHLSVFFLFILSVLLSITIIKAISLLPIGKYIVGNTKRSYKKKNSRTEKIIELESSPTTVTK